MGIARVYKRGLGVLGVRSPCIVYRSGPWGPSIKYLHNFTCYLDPLPTPLFACNINTTRKCRGDLTPLPLGAYITTGRSLVIQSVTGRVHKEEGQCMLKV